MKVQFFLMFSILLIASCENSNLERINVFDEKGKLKEWHHVRKEDRVKHGEYEVFSNGKLFEKGTFKDGKQEGSRKIYYQNGKVRIEEFYKNGNITGEYQSFAEDGTLQEKGQYDAESRMVGEWQYFYPTSGKVKEVVTFKNNVEDGAFREYYENGKLKTEGTYRPFQLGVETVGMEEGELLEYGENGKLITRKMCETGKCRTIWAAEKAE